jgi:hypothetical protein
MAIATQTLQHWLREAVACRTRNDTPGEEAAIQRALSVDPMDLLALLLAPTSSSDRASATKRPVHIAPCSP